MNDPISNLPSTPSLYVVATPIGNLADITMRALEVLRAVDVIAAEDTRHSQRLLDAHGIRGQLLAVHEHNEQSAAGLLIDHLAAGRRVALITDAGTPAVSDPGARTVARVAEAGYRVVPVPGPSAVVTALSVSGLADGPFLFHGFMPPKKAGRVSVLEGLKEVRATLVFYESPHRIVETVEDLLLVLGAGRNLVIARELTKQFEEVARIPLEEGPVWLAADGNRQRGEFVLLVSAPPPRDGLDAEAERVLALLLKEMPLKGAAKLTAEITGAPKNALYQRALALRGE